MGAGHSVRLRFENQTAENAEVTVKWTGDGGHQKLQLAPGASSEIAASGDHGTAACEVVFQRDRSRIRFGLEKRDVTDQGAFIQIQSRFVQLNGYTRGEFVPSPAAPQGQGPLQPPAPAPPVQLSHQRHPEVQINPALVAKSAFDVAPPPNVEQLDWNAVNDRFQYDFDVESEVLAAVVS